MSVLALFEPGQILRVAQVAFGIGLVIFVHELGHFLAARWCRVRVEMFSLGFGPRVFGWKRGPTTYQLALIPMGGFVKMAGEEGASGAVPAPDELPAKSVGQRFFIYSGGVLMNVLFALVVFPPLLFYGVPFPEPVAGPVDPGSPAWMAGIQPGTRILEVDGERVVSFEDIANDIGLSDGEEVRLLVRAPGSEEASYVTVRPRYEKAAGIRMIGLDPPIDPTHRVGVAPDSPASAAGLRDGDRILALDGSDERLVERVLLQMGRGEPVHLEVAGADGERRAVVIAPEVPPGKPKKDALLGIVPAESLVRALRPEGAASVLGLLPNDRILSVDGRAVGQHGDFELLVLAAHDRQFEIVVERAAATVRLDVPPLEVAALARAIADTAVIGDAQDTRVGVQPASPAAEAGMQTGDRLLSIGGKPVHSWQKVLDVLPTVAKARQPLAVQVRRTAPDGSATELDLSTLPGAFQFPAYGFSFTGSTYTFRAGSFGEAVRIGVQHTWKILGDAWHMLSGIFRGSVSGENLGGIIAISHVSYIFAGVGLPKLIFFLCMLSLSLAFINVLPIPVLDGGHLFFLLIEKAKGSPVNERVLGYSQMVGLVLILGLVVFVTFNDIKRLLE